MFEKGLKAIAFDEWEGNRWKAFGTVDIKKETNAFTCAN